MTQETIQTWGHKFYFDFQSVKIRLNLQVCLFASFFSFSLSAEKFLTSWRKSILSGFYKFQIILIFLSSDKPGSTENMKPWHRKIGTDTLIVNSTLPKIDAVKWIFSTLFATRLTHYVITESPLWLCWIRRQRRWVKRGTNLHGAMQFPSTKSQTTLQLGYTQ